MDEFLFYAGPDYAGHFVAVEFDNGVEDLDFLLWGGCGRHGSYFGGALVEWVVGW